MINTKAVHTRREDIYQSNDVITLVSKYRPELPGLILNK